MTGTGVCLCGEVDYSVEVELQVFGVGHGKIFQRQTGCAWSVLFVVADDQIKFSGDLTTYEDHADSGNVVYRHFCGTCGSPVKTSLPTQPGMTYIKAGTLDDTSVLHPQVHFWTDSKQEWVTVDENTPQIAKNPG